MSQAIRIALVIVAVVSIIALVSPLVINITDGLAQAFPMLASAISTMSPYFKFARRLLNCLIGNPTLAGIVITFVIAMPITHFFTSVVSRIYRLIVGQ